MTNDFESATYRVVMELLQRALDAYKQNETTKEEYHSAVCLVITFLTTLYATRYTQKPAEFIAQCTALMADTLRRNQIPTEVKSDGGHSQSPEPEKDD
jgi:hypothetical protein